MSYDEYPGVRQLVYTARTNKAGNTISNTTAKTAFASQITIPANAFQVGMVVQIHGYGQFTSLLALPGTVTCGLQLVNQSTGAITTLAQCSPLALAVNLSAMPYHFQGKLVFQSLGTAGAGVSGAILFYHSNGIGAPAASYIMGPNTNAIDTTVPQTLQLFTQFTIASSSVSSQLMLFSVESIQPVLASN